MVLHRPMMNNIATWWLSQHKHPVLHRFQAGSRMQKAMKYL
uniref:Uncharacterized protein n=1 Tax=Arundo donax TaxID=35708 RepID=A0A0A9AH76_ARUDO